MATSAVMVVPEMITAKCYEGGHMMYKSRGVRRLLKQDVSKFIQDIVAVARRQP